MRRVLIVVVLIIGAAVLGLWRSHGARGLSEAMGMSRNDPQGEARDEVRKSFQLQPGARLEVQGINGAVDIQTSDTKTVEVYVLRNASSKDALARRQVIIEQTADGLLVRCENSRNLSFWERLWGHNPNEQVSIKAPRQIALSLRGVNGRVNTGDIDGPLEVKGINGRVQLGQTSGSAEVSGINGNISVGLKQLSERGARVRGVNGNIELRLGSELNADLTARGMNGRVNSEIPTITVDKDDHGSHYSAHIGSGGAPIEIRGINGNVRLTSGEGAMNSTASEKKPGAANEKSEKPAVEAKSAKNSGQ